jgi:hypothetical protein
MSGPQFYQTPMGRRFYEHTMPELVAQLARVGDAVQALLVVWAKGTIENANGEKR